jgi:hypothetical protein
MEAGKTVPVSTAGGTEVCVFVEVAVEVDTEDGAVAVLVNRFESISSRSSPRTDQLPELRNVVSGPAANAQIGRNMKDTIAMIFESAFITS